MSQLIIIGGGKMGQAITDGLLKKGIQISAAVDPCSSKELVKEHGEAPLVFKKFPTKKTFKFYEYVEELDKTMPNDIIILAAKPQIMYECLHKIPQHCRDSLFVSIATGITTQKIENILGPNTKIISCAPSTLMQPSTTITNFYLNKNCTQADRTKIKKLLSKIGISNEVSDEQLIPPIREVQIPQLIIIGGGKMGQAITDGLLRSKKKRFSILTIVDPRPSPQLKERHDEIKKQYDEQLITLEKFPLDEPFRLCKDVRELNETMPDDIIILAVKPQIMKDVLLEIPQRCKESLFVSIAAGISIERIEKILGKNTRIIRAMPNTPAQIGKAVTFFYPNQNCTTADKSKIKKLFSAIGKSKKIDNEELIHSITAISGTGPAYLFYFIECMMDIAQEIGLSQEEAEYAVLETMKGTIQLIINEEKKKRKRNENKDIAQLRADVTSPKGTTEAAMEILINKKSGLKYILRDAVKHAQKRSKELN